jgi:hypothetical protein
LRENGLVGLLVGAWLLPFVEFETTSVNLHSVVRALRAGGLYDALWVKVSPEAQAILRNPMSSKWHPAPVVTEIHMELVGLVGAERFEELAYRAMKDSVSVFIRPLVRVALVLDGGSPRSVLSRLDKVVATTNRGLLVRWTESSSSTGVVTLDYGYACPREIIEPKWRGIFRYVAELAKTVIVVERVEAPGKGHFEFQLSW